MIVVIHAVLSVVLVLNGSFLSFYVSPHLLKKEKIEKNKITLLSESLQTKIKASFAVSFLGWWIGLFLLVLYLVVVE